MINGDGDGWFIEMPPGYISFYGQSFGNVSTSGDYSSFPMAISVIDGIGNSEGTVFILPLKNTRKE